MSITKIYIGTIIYFLLSVISLTARFTNYAGKKENVEIGKMKRFLWSVEALFNLRILLVALIPVVNVIFAMFFLLLPDDKLDDMFNKTIDALKEEK